MSKLWTTDKTEYLNNPSLIYFHPNQYATLKSIGHKKIHRCKYCKRVIVENNKNNYNNYCDEWCKELGSSKHLELCDKCQDCGKPIYFQAKKCEDCKKWKRKNYEK